MSRMGHEQANALRVKMCQEKTLDGTQGRTLGQVSQEAAF
jgi:hypothetical protein